MPPFVRLAVPLCLVWAGAAQALTADQVWQSWQERAAAVGLTVAADSAVRAGDALRLTGVSLAGAGPATINVAEIVLTEAADGSVQATFPAEVGSGFSSASGRGSLMVMQQGLTVTLRDGASPGSVVHDIAADRLDAALTLVDGDPAQADEYILNIMAGMQALTLTAETAPGDMARTTVALTAQTFDYEVVTRAQVLQSDSVQASTMADLAVTLDLSVPATLPPLAMMGAGDLAQALRDGLAARMTFDQGVAEQSEAVSDPAMTYDYVLTTQPGTSVLTLDRSGVAMEGQVPGGAVVATLGPMPDHPVEATFGAFDMLFRMPLIDTEAPEGFALRLGFADVVVDDALWDLFDAGRVFPRDAASVEVDLVGTARLDLLALAAEDAAAPLPEIVSLDLRRVALAVAGASLTGQGAFGFATGADGLPVPDGRAHFTLTGADALLDGAVATGLATADDVGGLRMLMGMFLRPGAEPGSLLSEVEARPDGSVLLNGMRVQ